MTNMGLDFRSGDYGGGEGWIRTSPRKELQGPRPAVLKINKDSHKIRKPPVPPAAAKHKPPQEPPPVDSRQPVIIYAVSPKVIHTTVSDFMNLVQRLTGNASPAAYGRASGDLSPAARIASIEKASPRFRDRETTTTSICNFDVTDFVGNILESTDLEVGTIPGILSPAPATLQPISPGFFSPAIDPFASSMFIPSPSNLFYAPQSAASPSTLFSASMAFPSPSSCDLFNPFFDLDLASGFI